MKKILIVNGSKRRKGNSYALEARIAEQLQGKAEVTTLQTHVSAAEDVQRSARRTVLLQTVSRM